MYFSGIADEAGKSIEQQIKAHKELGWDHIELRGVDGNNLTLISDEQFDRVEEAIKASGIRVSCFASALCNWSRKISGPFQLDLDELNQAIPRMHRLNSKFIRVMSFNSDGWGEAEWKAEAVKRLKVLTKMAEDGGITLAHENCDGWGGLGPKQTLELLDLMDSPNFKLVFDTGNTVPHGQDPWDYYSQVKDHIVYVHIKDAKKDENGKFAGYCYPGDGAARVRDIVGDLLARGFEGGLSIEPHVAAIAHEEGNRSKEEICYESYIKYGRQLMQVVDEVKKARA